MGGRSFAWFCEQIWRFWPLPDCISQRASSCCSFAPFLQPPLRVVDEEGVFATRGIRSGYIVCLYQNSELINSFSSVARDYPRNAILFDNRAITFGITGGNAPRPDGDLARYNAQGI
jgi:hypothetical protein